MTNKQVLSGFLILLLCACTEQIPTDRVVTNPIDLNYAFHPEVTMESLAWDIPPQILSGMSDNEKELALSALQKRNEGSAGAREAAENPALIPSRISCLNCRRSSGVRIVNSIQLQIILHV